MFIFKNIGIISLSFIIGSCFSNNKIQKEQQLLNKKDSLLIVNYKNGVDFIAEGNDPIRWQLKMDLDKSFDFFDNENFTISCTAVNPTMMADESEVYHATSGKVALTIKISEQKTNSDNVQNRNNKIVEILCNEKTFKGLGKYTYPIELHEIWLLERIGSKEYGNRKQFHKSPKLTFDLLNNKVIGFDGSERYRGDIDIHGNYIGFSFFSKKHKNNLDNEISDIISKQVENHLLEYYIKDNYLVILLNDDRRLIFKKKN